MRIIASVFILLAGTLPATAAVLVLANPTDSKLTFKLDRGTGTAESFELAKGESKAFDVARRSVLTYDVGDTPAVMTLDAFGVYVFTKQKGKLTLQGIDLAGKPVPLQDVPEKYPAPSTTRPSIKIRFHADSANPFVQSVWEPKLRSRIEKATAIVSAATGVAFEIGTASRWNSDHETESLDALRQEFEEKIKAEAGILQIGFTHRLPPRPGDPLPITLGKTLPPFRSHILIHEGSAKSESDQVELLVHELGHWLGALTSPDESSVMRAKIGDGRAVLASFKIRFDPLNLLAMHLWLAGPKAKSWEQLKPETQGRLARIYDTLGKAMPNDKPAEFVTALLAAHRSDAVAEATTEPAVPMPVPMTGNAVPAKPKNSKEEAIRRVVRGIAVRAVENASQPAGQRLTGDDLTAELVRTAADAAMNLEPALQVPAFAVGLGIGLDDSTILRSNPLTKSLCTSVESEAEYRERTKAVTAATLHNRRDTCQHFAVSCALADLVGLELARQAGLAKELQDMKGSSGFSFCDLCADLGGIEFIDRLKASPTMLGRVKQQFRVRDFVPSMDGLTEGHSAKEFTSKYGSIYDPRYKSVIKEIESRIQVLPGYAR